ncbi:MAG: hypothetical protein AAFN43_02630, partial [Pseudomonadota bacterium]
ITRRKIESTSPLTLNEIQADKDQLRAEFAMSTRRLEMSVDQLRDRASNQLIEINRRRDEVNKLSEEGRERLAELRQLEKKSETLSRNLEERENRLSELVDKHTRLQDQHDNLLEEVAKLREDHSRSVQSLKSREIEITANQATIEALKGTVSTIDMSENQQVKKINDLLDQLAGMKERLAEEKANTVDALARAKEAERELKEARKSAERDAKKIASFQSTSSQKGDNLSDLNSQLIEEKTRTVELEARLARQALQTEALLNDASNENVQEALRSLNDDLEEKSAAIQSVRAERDRLANELEQLKSATSSDWSDERQEKAFLRQQINDLAAKVAAMTAQFEGPESPIKAMLDEAEKSDKIAGDALSLADRIRAVQKASNAS